ncbi:hypothetical protein JW979_09615 [bacterium]|nr:hypothetical protein [candidate division CSSED10-310 bacterium]
MNPNHDLLTHINRAERTDIWEFRTTVTGDPRERIEQIKHVTGTWLAVKDNPQASPTLCALAVSALLKNSGYNPILTVNCRDCNRIALQSRLLGAMSLGITAILIESGIHPASGDDPHAKSVYDIDTVQLAGIAVGMSRRHQLLCGNTIDRATTLRVGVRLSPFKGNMQLQESMLRKYRDTPADFFVLETNDDMARFKKWYDSVYCKLCLSQIPIFICNSAGVKPEDNAIASQKGVAGWYYR